MISYSWAVRRVRLGLTAGIIQVRPDIMNHRPRAAVIGKKSLIPSWQASVSGWAETSAANGPNNNNDFTAHLYCELTGPVRNRGFMDLAMTCRHRQHWKSRQASCRYSLMEIREVDYNCPFTGVVITPPVFVEPFDNPAEV